MNLAWLLWFQKKSFYVPFKKSPFKGTHGAKKWIDTSMTKTGKSEHEKMDNTWSDDDTWID